MVETWFPDHESLFSATYWRSTLSSFEKIEREIWNFGFAFEWFLTFSDPWRGIAWSTCGKCGSWSSSCLVPPSYHRLGFPSWWPVCFFVYRHGSRAKGRICSEKDGSASPWLQSSHASRKLFRVQSIVGSRLWRLFFLPSTLKVFVPCSETHSQIFGDS